MIIKSKKYMLDKLGSFFLFFRGVPDESIKPAATIFKLYAGAGNPRL